MQSHSNAVYVNLINQFVFDCLNVFLIASLTRHVSYELILCVHIHFVSQFCHSLVPYGLGLVSKSKTSLQQNLKRL